MQVAGRDCSKDNGTTSNAFDIDADSLTTANALDISLNGLTTGVGLNLISTSSAFTSGKLIQADHTATYKNLNFLL